MAVDVVFLNGNSVNNIDTNFQRVKEALQEALGRNGDLPNQMNVDLDMNSSDILNANEISVRSIILDGEVLSPFGPQGWSPVFGAVEHNGNIIMRLVDYVGGKGDKPTEYIGQYVGSNGYVTNPNDATNFGSAGVTDGDKGDVIVSGAGSAWEVKKASQIQAEDVDDTTASNVVMMTPLRTLQGVRASLKYDGFVTPKMFGAKGEYDLGTFSGPDEVSYIQEAVDACLEETDGKGGEVLFPPGNWYVASTPINVPNGSVPGTNNDFGRVSLRGYGAGASQIVVSSPIAVQLGYETSTNVHRYQYISDLHFRSVGGLRLNTAIAGGGLAYLHLYRTVLENFEYGMNVADMLSSEIDHCVLRGNEYGVIAARGGYSHPNAISMHATKVQASGTWGVFLSRPSAFSMFGGTVEGNGLNTLIPKAERGGILLVNSGNEGATNLQATGTYFEFNDGIADVYSTSGVGEKGVAMGFHGCTFARISATQFVNQHILMNHEERASLGVFGCGFGTFNDWVPGSSGAVWATSPVVDVSEAGNFFQNDNERPAVPANQSVSLSTQVSGRGYVNADGTLVAGARGIAGVSHIGAGLYSVTFDGEDIHPRHIEATSRGLVGNICVTSTTVDGSGRTVAGVNTYDLAGTLVDRPFTITSYGGW